MRRTHLRGHENILKRLLVHVGGFNLGLLMRTVSGVGTPRGLQGLLPALRDADRDAVGAAGGAYLTDFTPYGGKWSPARSLRASTGRHLLEGLLATGLVHRPHRSVL